MKLKAVLARMKHSNRQALSPRSSPHGTRGVGILGFAVDKSERYAFSLGLGYLKGFYRERFMLKGYGGDLWVGAAATLAGFMTNVVSAGRSPVAPHLERLGDAGMQSFLNGLGITWGAQKAGRDVVSLPPKMKAGAPPRVQGVDVLGMIPPAMGGVYLTADEVAHFSGRR